MRTDAIGRASPDGVKHVHGAVAALRGGQAGFGGLPGLRGRRAVAKALKGHCDWEVRTLAPP